MAESQRPKVKFEGIGLSPDQRAFVNSVITGKGFKNPVDKKMRSLYTSVTDAIKKLNTDGLLGTDEISQEYQDLFQLKLQNLELAIVEYWKHSNKLSGVVDSEIEEIRDYEEVYATTPPPKFRKNVVVGSTKGASPTIGADKPTVGCATNVAEFYNRLITSVNYCTARAEMARDEDCEFGPFDSIIGPINQIIVGVDRGVECGPGCCDPCTKMKCTGLEPVCFGLKGIVDHVVSVKNSIGGQQGIDAALALAYEYTLGVDRLTAELYCLINTDNLNYCRQTKYVERFTLGQKISNDILNNGPMSSVLTSFFGAKVK